MKIFMLNLLKKIIKKKTTNIQEACQTLKISGEAISSHIISFQFPVEEPKIKWFEAEILAVTGDIFFLDHLKWKGFYNQSKKIIISLITGESVYVNSTVSIALFWSSPRFIYFFFFILLQLFYW